MSKFKLSRFKVFLGYMAWWTLLTIVQTFLLVKNGFEMKTALQDALVTQFIFSIAGYVINTSMHSYQPSPKNSWYVLGWSVTLSIICVFLQKWILFSVLMEDPEYESFFQGTLILREAFGWLMIIMVALLTWIWVYIAERQENEKRREDATRLAREAELTNLRQQLQPHFLFNSLNSISALAGTRPEEARKMIQQLSDFLRGTIKKDDASLLTLDEELRHLQLYLDIEKVRFGHRLNTEVNKSADSLTMEIPSLLLQPIVENAIKFGLYDTIGEITISIKAWKENSLLCIEVRNPFDAQTASPTHGTGFGLSSVKRRLYLLYSRNDLLSTEQTENTFITTIKIPQTA